MNNLYYTPPSNEIFEEVKQKSIELWQTMGSEPSYSQEKIGRIKDLKNIEDNVMYMVAMFDMNNQSKLASRLSPEANLAIGERLMAGGTPPEYIPFKKYVF